MRDIKARIWDDDNKQFDFIDLLNIEQVRQVYDGLGSYFSMGYLQSHPEFFQLGTGLKDKNGVEIYEGDVVEFFSRDGMRNPVEMIEKHVIAWRSGDVDMYHGFPLPWNFYGTLKWSDKSTIEVIGNIYENPDFLKENKTQNH